MINPWLFEFLQSPAPPGEPVTPPAAAAPFAAAIALWQRLEQLGFAGIFFSEHHFGLSYSPAPNLLIAALAQRTERLRLGVMGMVLPFYQPWRVLEEIAMLDHLSGGRLEIGCAMGVPQELIRIGLSMEEARARFDEALDILDAGLAQPVISHRGRFWQFDDLAIVPRPLQQPWPPKWTTVVSPGSARRSAARRSNICTAFASVARIAEIFDAYRAETDRLGIEAGPEQLAIRRNVSVARSAAEAAEGALLAQAATRAVLAGDPRVAPPGMHASDGEKPLSSPPLQADASQSFSPPPLGAEGEGEVGETPLRPPSLLDAHPAGSGFAVHADEFIAGTPSQVAEQIIGQCRACGAGHVLAILGRAVDRHRAAAVTLFGEEVIPALRRAAVR